MKKRCFKAAVFIVTIMLTGSACAQGRDEPNEQSESKNTTDPRGGEVRLNDQNGSRVSKRCDGTTLVYVSNGYNSGGVAVIASSQECS